MPFSEEGLCFLTPFPKLPTEKSSYRLNYSLQLKFVIATNFVNFFYSFFLLPDACGKKRVKKS